MRILKTTLVTLLLLTALGLGGIGCSGGGAKVQTSSTTLGQELQDLHEAKEQGIITEKEYEKKKKELMKRKY